MNKKRILFLIDTLENGGAEKVLTTLLLKLNKEKFDLTVMLLYNKGIYLKQLPDHIHIKSIFEDNNPSNGKLRFLVYDLYTRVILKLMLKLPYFGKWWLGLKKGQYDTAISFCEGYNSLVLKNILNVFTSTAIWIHTDLSKHIIADKLKGVSGLFNRVNKIIFVSNEAKEGFVNKFGSQHDQKLEVVYNFIDRESIELLATEAIPYRKNAFTIISIGRLQPEKGFDKLINAHHYLIQKGYSIETIILGNGPLFEKYNQLIDSLKIQASCRLLGFIPNVYPYIVMSDMLALVSDYEGLPTVICEAMILKKPILSTEITGVIHLLNHGEFGMMVENNQEAINKGIERLITDDNLRAQYSKTLDKSQDKFIFLPTIDKIEKLLLKI